MILSSARYSLASAHVGMSVMSLSARVSFLKKASSGSPLIAFQRNNEYAPGST